MNPIIYLAVFAITVVAAFIFGRATAEPLDDGSAPLDPSSTKGKSTTGKQTYNDRIRELEGELRNAEKSAKEREDALRKLREESRDAKQKAHDRGERLEQARKALEDERRRAKNLGSIEAARKQMLDAREEVERLKAELEDRSASRAPTKVVEPVAAPVEAKSTIDPSVLEAQLDAKDDETRRALQDQAKTLKSSFDAQVSEERDRYKNEIRSLQKRLRVALRDFDKARRSAEANDRAYLILKSQLEGTLDRLAFHDPNLRRPDELNRPAAQPAAAPTKDAAKASDTPAEAPKKPAEKPASDAAKAPEAAATADDKTPEAPAEDA